MILTLDDDFKMGTQQVDYVAVGDKIVWEKLNPVTSGMTLTNTFVDGQNIGLSSRQRMSLRMDAWLTPSGTGLLFELGNANKAMILYQLSGILYFQAGRGDNFFAMSVRGETSYVVPESKRFMIEISADKDVGIALNIDGSLVDTSQFSLAELASVNAGKVGGVGGSVIGVNRAGWTSTSNVVRHPGVTDLKIFLNQTTGQESIVM